MVFTHDMTNICLEAWRLETGTRGFDISRQAGHEHGSCIMHPQLCNGWVHTLTSQLFVISTSHPARPDITPSRESTFMRVHRFTKNGDHPFYDERRVLGTDQASQKTTQNGPPWWVEFVIVK